MAEHIVIPQGVAVEVLDGGKRKLADVCPPPLLKLLKSKDSVQIYEKLVQSVVHESKTRNVFGKWRDVEFLHILDEYKEDFADRGIKVVLCRRKSASQTRRWLEFIDIAMAHGYVPQYDVSNFSGQVIKTAYCTLEFPHGVVAEELNRYGPVNKKLKEKMPILIEEMMAEKGLMKQYDALVDAFVAADKGRLSKWNMGEVNAVVQKHAPEFEAKGVSIFFCHKREYINHGNHGYDKYFRWIEFVDRKEQPNYYPQHDEKQQQHYCVIS